MPDLISLQQAAKLIGKNLRTIQRYLKTGKISYHQENGKNLVSRKEIEEKILKRSSKSNVELAELQEKKPEIDNTKDELLKSVQENSFWQKEAVKYQNHWINEIREHAGTREQLGHWKGRVEAYQSFAPRLLSNGQEQTKSKNKFYSLLKTPLANYRIATVNSIIIYLLIGIIFLIFVFVLLAGPILVSQ